MLKCIHFCTNITLWSVLIQILSEKIPYFDFTILCFLSGRGCSFDRTAQVLHALKFPNVCECFTGPRVSAVFRGLRVSEGLQRVGGGMGTGVPRSVPASSVPAFRGLTRTRRSTHKNFHQYLDNFFFADGQTGLLGHTHTQKLQ